MTQETLDADITHIALKGRLDIEGSQEIDLRFSLATTSNPGKFVIDLSEVSFIASIGIRLLLTAGRAQARRGGKTVIVPPQGMGGDVLKTAGVDLIIPIFPGLEAARAGLGGTALKL